MSKGTIYIVGSLRNPLIPTIGNALRADGFDAFDDWHGAGPAADDEWFRYEKERGRSMREALAGRAAQTIFSFDKSNLDRSHGALLVLPAGKSGHLELGYMIGKGKPAVIFFPEEPERWDVMYNFASDVIVGDVDMAVRSIRHKVHAYREFKKRQHQARENFFSRNELMNDSPGRYSSDHGYFEPFPRGDKGVFGPIG